MRFLDSILIVLSIAQHGWCWGDLGHRTVAYIAQKYLTDSASQLFDSILANDNGWDFSDAATWADTVRQSRRYTSTWHYVDARDTPPTRCGLKYPADCSAQGPNGCVITAINNQTALFLNPSSTSITRKEALMFLMHFIGDLHQPLHVEDAFRGGNEIKPLQFGSTHNLNLHGVWDTNIPHKITGLRTGASNDEEKVAAAEWADELFALNVRNGVQVNEECSDVDVPDRCALSWANDSNAWICKFVLEESVEWLKANDLSRGYYDGAKPIVEELVGKAGARLGAWLNTLAAAVAEQEVGGQDQKVLGEEKFDL